MADNATTADLLFELGTEELPPKALKRLSDALTKGFVRGLDDAGLTHGETETFCTPRRLALLVRGCAKTQADQDIERRGPALQAAFDEDGKATKAAEGFARSCGVDVDALARLETDKGTWLVYRHRQPGRAAAELLPGIAETALNGLPIPKRMRWGASEALFVRPVQWLVFLHGDEIVPCSLLDAKAGNQTFGHRFHHPDAITLYSPEDYADILRTLGKVIAHFGERLEKIKVMVEQAAEAVGGHADLDSDLLDEVTALTEWPLAISGSFEQRFLQVPQEALVATMKGNQKYFPVFGAEGQLMAHFITLANLESANPELVREGNERVIRPRLADAMFFWDQDGKRRLADHYERLDQVVFQKDLGSMRDKSDRVAALAEFIADAIGGDRVLARRAGELSRCDLMTETVYEFPEMQGIMGRYQAQRDGEPAEISLAMDEFYMPRFSGDRLPETQTGIAVSLAERVDSLVGIFGVGLRPTGDKDPFALRRAALGALRILREHALPIDLDRLLAEAERHLGERLSEADVVSTVHAYMFDRLKGLYLDEGTAIDVFEAVVAVSPASIVDFEHRVRAVGDFKRLHEAASLTAANKRISNILRKAGAGDLGPPDPSLFEGAAERTLFDALQVVVREVDRLAAETAYGAMLQQLSNLRAPVDQFFDDVMVMADDETVRRNRLALLATLRSQFLRVADVSHLQT